MVTDNSKTHIDPLDYFDPNRPIALQAHFNKYFYAMALPIFFSGSVIINNLMNNRPMYSGYHKFLGALCGGIVLGRLAEYLQQRQTARRDDQIYHYIKTHPQDFPLIERIKYRDVLERWTPIR